MTDTIRWGILGAGAIAGAFAEGLTMLPDAALVAVGSRKRDTAEAFGARYGIPNCHSSYAELAADPSVDVIYIATPHTFHMENSLLCLRAGKAVLCEKPFTINAAEAATLVQEARARGVFLMEAMWTRFLPHIQELRRLIDAGAIGTPRLLNATFCFQASDNPEGRLLNPALGGGALLDVGIYPLTLADLIFGPPEEVLSTAQIGATGVDEQAGLLLRYAGGQIALISAAIRTELVVDAYLAGSAGTIQLKHPWWTPSELTLVRPGGAREPIALPSVGNGYTYEAAETMRCMRAGLIESPIMPHAKSIAMMELLDSIRAQWGLRYPGE